MLAVLVYESHHQYHAFTSANDDEINGRFKECKQVQDIPS